MSSRILHPALLTANLLRFVLEEPGHAATKLEARPASSPL